MLIGRRWSTANQELENPEIYASQSAISILYPDLSIMEQIQIMTKFSALWIEPIDRQLYQSDEAQLEFASHGYDFAVGQFMEYSPIMLSHAFGVKHFIWSMVGHDHLISTSETIWKYVQWYICIYIPSYSWLHILLKVIIVGPYDVII